MAGQPQDPSFQPHGQDQTQVRPVWQQPTYTPPTGNPQDTAVFASGQQGQGQGQAQAQGYPGPSYAQQSQSQSQGQGYEGYEDYAAQSYPGQQGQQSQGTPPPQWNAYTGTPGADMGAQPSRQRSADSKGFVASLFDFSFTSFVTPKIVRVIYILLTLWTGLWGLIFLIAAFNYGGMGGGLFTLVILEPIYILLTLGVYRVILEAFVVVFRLYEETRKIRELNESRG
jgi:hypothetical protein